MKPSTLALAACAAATVLGARAANADQCQLIDSGTAVRALQLLHDHPNVAAFCEPCGDKAPGDPVPAARVTTERVPGARGGRDGGGYQLVIDRREVDLAYTFVQTGPERYDNLAVLAGCPASGVSSAIAIHAPPPPVPARVVIPPARDLEALEPHTTYVIRSPHDVSFWALLGTCTATSAACTLGLFFLLRRRRLAMRPRAISLLDKRDS